VARRITGDALQQLVGQHAALQRVAILVARQPPTADVFAVVTREAGMLLGARMTALLRVESPQTAVIVAGWSHDETPVPVGSRGVLDGHGLLGRILRTGQAVRLEDFDEVGGAVAAEMRSLGVRSAVAGPIVLGGRIWGALSAAWPQRERTPVGAEDRVAAFAELVSYAIDNAETRDELLASRARLVKAADEQRRRVVRDLHDGAQQRLIHAVTILQLAHSRDDAPPELARLVGEALEDTRAAIDELRELAHGIHPAVLTHRGLAAAVEALADRRHRGADEHSQVRPRLDRARHRNTHRRCPRHRRRGRRRRRRETVAGQRALRPARPRSRLGWHAARRQSAPRGHPYPRQDPAAAFPEQRPRRLRRRRARALTAAPAGRRRSPGPHVLRQPGHPPAFRARAGGSRGACRRPLTPKVRGETSPLSTRTAVPPALSTSMRQGAAAPAGLIDWPAAAFARSSDRR
jgi:signal transduction histidine kinase